MRTPQGVVPALRHRVARAGSVLVLGLAVGSVGAQGVPVNTPPPRPTLPEPANPSLPSLVLVGDSTVRNGRGDGANGQWGWGEPLVALFDTTRINLVNRALGGRSSRTYQTQGLWDETLPLLKPGDFLLIQFGHNDGGPVNDNSRARGTLKGVGEETEEIDNLLTGQHEVVHTFGWYMRKYVVEAKAKGVTPIVCSLVPRKVWKDGKIERSSADYALWASQVAAAEGVAFVDLNEIIARHYEELGFAKVEALFADERTHTTRAGAELNAAAVVTGLRSLKDCALCRFLADGVVVLTPSATMPAPTYGFAPPLPHLERRGSATQLIVDGEPYLALAGELRNSSSSSLEYLRLIWPKLVQMRLNTVLAAVSWEQIEPAPGRFDFSVVDGLLAEARRRNLRIILLWFGSWKNGTSRYAADWVKLDQEKYPRVRNKDGRTVEILSPFGDTSREADARAFAALMRHVRSVDEATRTVIMIQVQNEV
jgi:rhamnogalacturonan acetylesterase